MATAPRTHIVKSLETGLDINEVGGDVIKSLSRSGKLQLRYANSIAKALGAKVVVFQSRTVTDENGVKSNVVNTDIARKLGLKDGKAPYGAYSTKDGTIYIDLNGKGSNQDMYVYTLAHEFTHSIAQNAEAQFNDLSDFLIKELGITNSKELINRKMERQNLTLLEAREEFVADCCEEMLLSKDFIDHFSNLYAENKGLANKLLRVMKKAWLELKNLVNSLSGDGLSDEALAVRRMSNNSKKLLAQKYAEALKVVSGNYVSENTKSATETPKTNSVKNQYAGERSLTKNSDLLEKAQTMYKNGADSEEIRQKTGWFKGYDGKWRYEIDDSKSEFDKRAFGKFSDDKNTYIDIIANDEMVLKHDIWRRLYDSGVNAIVRVEDVYKMMLCLMHIPNLKTSGLISKRFIMIQTMVLTMMKPI